MDYFTCNVPHPYGALPTGNSFFASDKDLHVRYFGLGHLNSVSDEVLMEIVSFCCGPTVISLLESSRALYAYCHFTDVWRDLTLRQFKCENIKFINNWKDTYVNTIARQKLHTTVLHHTPISMKGIFSNLLHRSWACRTCDLEVACPGILKFNDIQRVSASELSTTDFVEQYEKRNIPLVITDAVKDWPAFEKWSTEYIVKSFGDAKMRATSAAAPIPVLFTASEYFQYADQTQEEAPLYLFERNFAAIAPCIDSDYHVPSYFADNAYHGTDLFRVFGSDRPDYRWLIAGPARSGSIFHIDPNQTNAWNVCIKGRKKWIFYPPSVNPPGVKSSPDGAEVAVPISTGEWLLSFWRYHLEARKHPDVTQRPLEVVLNPGEIMFVPHGYWHMVVNLDDCIALTHNYVSTSNLGDCLRFLRDTPDQISGVRDRLQQGCIQPDNMYTEFLKRLESVLPLDVIETHVQESLKINPLLITEKMNKSGSVHSQKRKKAKTNNTTTDDNNTNNSNTNSLAWTNTAGSGSVSEVNEVEQGGGAGFSFGFDF